MDKETAAITAQNAHASSVSPVDPSEAPSTPTVIGDMPVKSKTFPTPSTPGHDTHVRVQDFESPIAPRHDVDHDRGKKGHVLFLDTKDIDGTGRLFDNEGEIVQSPQTARSSVINDGQLLGVGGRGDVVASPVSSTFRLPHEHDRQQAASTLAPVQLAAPLSAHTEGTKVDGLPTTSRTEAGDIAPAPAQPPSERDTIDDDQERPRVERQDTEIPEGMGSKRMFKMSKMFSKSETTDHPPDEGLG